MSSHDEWVFNKLDRYFHMRLAAIEPSAAAENILSKLPTEIMDHNKLVNYIREDIGIQDQNLVNQSIEILVTQGKLIRVEKPDGSGQFFYKKLDLGLSENKLPNFQQQNQNSINPQSNNSGRRFQGQRFR